MSNNTVFVIGSGASEEADLPTGEDLKCTISKYLDIERDLGRLVTGDPHIYRSLIDIARERKEAEIEYIRHAIHISEALPLAESIDNFLDQHRSNDKMALCGKLAIVRCILEAENKSSLRYGEHNEKPDVTSKQINKSWYNPFFKIRLFRKISG